MFLQGKIRRRKILSEFFRKLFLPTFVMFTNYFPNFERYFLRNQVIISDGVF